VSSEGVTASFDAELTEVGDDRLTLAQPTVALKKVQVFVPFSIEVGEDWAGLQAELGRCSPIARTCWRRTGSSTGPPQPSRRGWSPAARKPSTRGHGVRGRRCLRGAGGVAAPVPTQRHVAWHERDRQRHPSVRGEGRCRRTGLMSDDRTSILGKPYRETSTLDATTGSGDHPLVYGDIRAGFRIVDRVGLSVELIPHLFGSNQRPIGVRGLYAYWRTGSTVQVPNALRVLKSRDKPPRDFLLFPAGRHGVPGPAVAAPVRAVSYPRDHQPRNSGRASAGPYERFYPRPRVGTPHGSSPGVLGVPPGCESAAVRGHPSRYLKPSGRSLPMGMCGLDTRNP
jgi:hypothetical protein